MTGVTGSLVSPKLKIWFLLAFEKRYFFKEIRLCGCKVRDKPKDSSTNQSFIKKNPHVSYLTISVGIPREFDSQQPRERGVTLPGKGQRLPVPNQN